MALLSLAMGPAFAATFVSQYDNTGNADNSGFDQAASTIGIGAQSYNAHLSSSHIKTPPTDSIDDVLQNGISNPEPNSPNNVTSSS